MAVADLMDAFASTDAVPGGGSAAALAGAVGASLLLMVAGMPKTRTGAPEETADLAEAASRLHPLRDSLLDLVDRDSDAYRQVMDAFRLAKESDEEKATRFEFAHRAGYIFASCGDYRAEDAVGEFEVEACPASRITTIILAPSSIKGGQMVALQEIIAAFR